MRRERKTAKRCAVAEIGCKCAPELARAGFTGRIGEPRLKFAMDSLMLDALSADFEDLLYLSGGLYMPSSWSMI